MGSVRRAFATGVLKVQDENQDRPRIHSWVVVSERSADLYKADTTKVGEIYPWPSWSSVRQQVSCVAQQIRLQRLHGTWWHQPHRLSVIWLDFAELYNALELQFLLARGNISLEMESPEAVVTEQTWEAAWWSFLLQENKLISKRLDQAVDAAGGLFPTQFGFRKGKSTLDAIQTVTGIAAEAIRGKHWKGGTKKYRLLVTLDINNVFNTVNWTRIIQALRRQRIPEYLERVLLFDTRVQRYCWGPTRIGPGTPVVEQNVRWSAEASHACQRSRDWLRGRRRHYDRG